ncbi:MAG: transketolase [Actinobacteria bacterium]|nr:transketolase [Actinomycetota bacterium]
MSTVVKDAALQERCIETIRFLAVDGVQKANSGHPGMPMGAAAIAYTLFTRHLRYDPADPQWPNRDRFVLSAGHASMLLYSMLHLTGYDVTMDDLKAFRQWQSKTPGHPEYGHTPGVETTTGPLGQGVANAVGMALAERYLAATFGGDVMDHYTYVLAGDGCMMEGISGEAASFAGHQQLGKLILLYDDNHITIDGSTDLAFTEDVCKRYEAYGWHVQRVTDGNDVDAIDAAIAAAKNETGKPSIIAVRTHIGCGSPNKQDKAAAHGAPLGADEVKLTKEACEWPLEPAFYVPDDVREAFAAAARQAAASHAEWTKKYEAWRAADPDRAASWDDAWAGALPEGWDADLPIFTTEDKLATRAASGKVINAVAPHIPTLIGGSADLAPSNNTLIQGSDDQQAATPAGRNVRWGVRELAMAAMANGLSAHGGIRPYVATFFVFVDYMRPAMRLSALMDLPVIYVLTHDSIGVGEDGPTHQPVEHLAMLRATPGFVDLRPADANETVEAWKVALQTKDAPVGLMLTRQGLPTIDREKYAAADGVARGAYVLHDNAGGGVPDVILIASGSEVALALEAHERLVAEGVRSRLVNMASMRLFEQQDADYRESVLPASCSSRVAVEAGVTFGWERYVGDGGVVIGIDHFGASAPAGTLFEQFGFTADNVYARAKALLA